MFCRANGPCDPKTKRGRGRMRRTSGRNWGEKNPAKKDLQMSACRPCSRTNTWSRKKCCWRKSKDWKMFCEANESLKPKNKMRAREKEEKERQERMKDMLITQTISSTYLFTQVKRYVETKRWTSLCLSKIILLTITISWWYFKNLHIYLTVFQVTAKTHRQDEKQNKTSLISFPLFHKEKTKIAAWGLWGRDRVVTWEKHWKNLFYCAAEEMLVLFIQMVRSVIWTYLQSRGENG